MKANLLILLVVLCCSRWSMAGVETFSERIEGSQITTSGAPQMAVYDDKYYTMATTVGWQNQFINAKVSNRIRLGINPDVLQTNALSGGVTISVKSWKWNASTSSFITSIETRTLAVTYDMTETNVIDELSTYTATNAHRMEITITSVNGGAGFDVNDVYLQAEIEVERYYAFGGTAPASPSAAVSGEYIDFEWSQVTGAEWYELEWVHVNDYTAALATTLMPTSSLMFDFYKNSTRVLVRTPYYRIPAQYDRGYLAFRVRAIGVAGPKNDVRKEGSWTAPESGAISILSTTSQVITLAGTVDIAMNWGRQVGYTDGGKRLEGTTFADGLGRVRQAVGHNTETGQAVISNVYYDGYGRVAVSDLPTPEDDERLSHRFNFNWADGSDHFGPDYFDQVFIEDSPTCSFESAGFSLSAGAGKYYSPNNPDQDAENKRIPDAQHYPYTRVEYMDDHTGRLRSTGGFGPDFTIGSGHETQYYYSTPTQEELDRLFGSEAGYDQHYQKRVTVDANNQAYVEYFDMAGRVVATGLAGANPNALDALDNNTVSTMTQTITSGLNGEITPTSMTLTYPFQVFHAADVTFNYDLNPAQFTESTCLPDICFDCAYILRIKVTEEVCGDVVFSNTHHINGAAYDAICNGTYPYAQDTTAHLEANSYVLTKELIVDQDAIDAYWCTYIDHTTCVPTFAELFNTAYAAADFSSCTDTPEPVNDDETDDNPCAVSRTAMLHDMSPGGQYADFTVTGSTYTAANTISILNTSTGVLAGDWKHPSGDYANATGGIALVEVTLVSPGVYVPAIDASPTTLSTTPLANGNYTIQPEDLLDLGDFVQLFQDSWAGALLPFHPEYCYLQFCDANSASHDYDAAMSGVTTHTVACSSGLYAPMGSVAHNSSGYYDGCDDTHPDPFFATGGGGAAYHAVMEGRVNAYIQVGGMTLSLLDYAVYRNSCPDAVTSADLTNCIRNYAGSCYDDAIWLTFRDLYQELKDSLYSVAEAAGTTACNGHGIGTTAPFEAATPRWGFIQAALAVDYSLTANDPYLATSAQSAQLCGDVCAHYADEWLAALASCPAIAGLSAGHRADLRTDLISLCSYGCSEDHPSGATTLPATITPSPLSLIGGTVTGGATINDVLALYIPGFTESDLCTELLVSEPGPYNEQPTGVHYLDTCGCDLLLETNKEFNDGKEGLPEGVTTVEELLAYNTGLSMEDIDAMICKCNKVAGDWESGYVWTDKNQTTIRSWMTAVPEQLTCNDCIRCDALSHEMSQLVRRFGSEFSESDRYAVILTNYFNQQFGFELTYADYAAFMLKCSGTSEEPVCEPTPELLSWLEVMNLLAHRGEFVSDGSVDLLTENVVYPHSPLQQALSASQFRSGLGGNVIDLLFIKDEEALPCTTQLTLPDDPGFGFGDIVAFNQVYPTGGSCEAPSGTFNVEVTYISCGQLQTAVLSGTTDCFPVQQCYCGDVTLCNESTGDQFADQTPCYEPVLSQLYQQTEEHYLQAIADARAAFETDYNTHCSAAFATEQFQYTGPFNLYQYTLYYYDQAGNLVKTIAPKGVVPATGFTAIDASRTSTTGIDGQAAAVVPSHTYKTEYTYNSYDQLVQTTNPDQDGATKFWYDRYGRIVASQNPVQAAENKYSYSLYDPQGRPIEVGQVVKTGTFPESTVKADDLGAGFRNWVYTTSTQTEVTVTVYDESLLGIPAKFSNGLQQNLRLRVASVFYFETFNSSTIYVEDYTTAIHYSYDLHGNVIETLQDVGIHEVVEVLQGVKSTQYEFELLSGNVKKVKYQQGQLDQQVHAYIYDRLNRLVEVFTSNDGEIHQSREAYYRYFDYGPLARVEIGQHKVQANDYAYTINGWLKGMNSNTLDCTRDGGKDGSTGYYAGNANAHEWVARDVTGYTMGYYAGDYRSIASTSFEAAVGSGNAFSDAIRPLYNGNIAYTTTAIAGFATQAAVYGYDQLQRLKSMQVYRQSSLSTTNSWAGSAAVDDYQSTYSYDANGNLVSLLRNGNATDGLGMDNFTYHYASIGSTASNRLDYVSDTETGTTVYDDIKNGQLAGNYTYDKIGELVSDSQEGIDEILWRRGDRRVNKITRDDANSDELEFYYNPLGQRLLKVAKKRVSGVVQAQSTWVYTYYGYDANGQVMATYALTVGGATETATLNEQMLYGSGRIGEAGVNKLIYSSATGVPTLGDVNVNKLGLKKYELTNHLGNVLAVITDRKVVSSGGSPSVYAAVVIMKSDYYPFGMEMPGRSSNTSAYRFGYNGMEKDPEMKGDGNSYTTEFRQYDPRLGRWMSLDPMAAKFPNMSPYVAFNNNPVKNVDLKGLEAWPVENAWTQEHIQGYRNSVLEISEYYRANDIEFTCEDLALVVLTVYAYANNLPLTITNGSGTYNQEDFDDFRTFLIEILKTSAAEDLARPENSVKVGSTFSDIREAKRGNLLLLKYDTDDYKHVQIISFNDTKHNRVYIRQGNANLSYSPDPSAVVYSGLNQEKGVYNMNKTDPDKNGYYYNYYTHNKYEDPINELHPVVFDWNFQNFNNNSKSSKGQGNIYGPVDSEIKNNSINEPTSEKNEGYG